MKTGFELTLKEFVADGHYVANMNVSDDLIWAIKNGDEKAAAHIVQQLIRSIDLKKNPPTKRAK